VDQEPRPDLIRQRLGLAAATRIVLYQGGLMTERGIEQTMDAILDVPDAVLVLLGFGPLQDTLTARAAAEPYRGHVHLIDAVLPAELVRWTASADLMAICIQPTTPNHVHSTPNKLFEALAAGTPVVASDLPGMASIVRDVDFGALVDPTSPSAIASAIRTLLDEPTEARLARRRRGLDAARTLYHWEAQEARLLELCQALLARGSAGP
jgi:glycosyltransferase involved in cell wall biosynthesis